MQKLDKRKPYGTIFGEYHACYTQDGKNFDGQGNEVNDKGEVVKDKKETAPDDNLELVLEPEEESTEEEEDWRILKKKVIAAGGVWSNSKKAIAYLESI